MSDETLEGRIADKMRREGLGGATIAAFLDAHRRVRRGERGLIAEAEIEPISDLPRLESLPGVGEAEGTDEVGLLRQLAVFKLNGGLGTGMGLDRTKSLLRVRGEDSFLDFIARQVLFLRERTGGTAPRFVLMNSFSTRAETLEYLGKYPELLATGPVDFLQSKVPKVREDNWEPVAWPADPDLEWCPPGHGDFYPSLVGSGMLEALLEAGIRYAFVSNSDNLGATVDGRLLRHLAESGQSFVMEVAERTGADRKGGHLARRSASGRLLLRESAQCPEADEGSFQDIERHRYFNTNNLWIRLDRLHEALGRAGGTLTLPLITNRKTVDPRDAGSPRVVQLEAAMGAAIECLDDAGAVVVTRDRFSPVKGTGDLLALRSDAYTTTPDHRLVLAEARRGRPPVIELDGKRYKVLADFEALFPEGAPSLVDCEFLRVEGPVRFGAGVVCSGRVVFRHRGTEPRTVAAGTYRDTEVGLS